MPLAAGVARCGGPGRRRARRRVAAAALVGALGALAGGCEREAALVGTGPIRSVEVGPDGSAYVLRAWRDRTPGSTVLLDVDPATGAAAPILPRLPGRRGATVRTIELAVPRPAAATEGGPVELVLVGPDVGLARIRGPFAYLGAFPELEILDETRLLPPAAGPAASVSPDGNRLLLFAPERNGPGEWAYVPVIVDLTDLSRRRAVRALPGREGTWLASGAAQVVGPDGPLRAEPTEAGRLRLVPVDGTAAKAPPARGWTRAAGGELVRTAGGPDGPADSAPLDWPAPLAGVTPLAAAPVPGTDGAGGGPTDGSAPRTVALAWTGRLLLRVTADADGTLGAVPLDLTFDRGR